LSVEGGGIVDSEEYSKEILELDDGGVKVDFDYFSMPSCAT
jgi:hypothetical protein